MKSSKRLFLAFNLAVLLLGLLPLFQLARGGAPFRLGLDLAGGTRVTYRPDLASRLEWTRDLSDRELLQEAKEVLSSRLGRVLNTVPDVVVLDDERLVISVPGDQDRRAVLDLVGRTYRLTFRLVEGEAATASNAFTYRGRALDLAPPAFSGEMLEEGSIRAVPASAAQELGAGATVAFDFQVAHRDAFAEFTGRNAGREMAILIDDDVEWVGTIDGAIRGTGSLRGAYTLEEASEIATMLRSGTLPVSLRVESLETVTPSLGREVRELGLEALAVSGVLLVLLVAVAYARRGWLVLNGWIALGALLSSMAGLASLFGLTLDMVGIAAVILSVGMGMDAFILVFESLMARWKDSDRSDGPADRRRAFNAGPAYSLGAEGGALLHGNVTTLLAVLLLLGNERLHSFAVFVAVGVAASALTILLTRVNLRSTPQSLPGLPFDPLALLRGTRVGLFRWRAVYGVAAVVALLLLGGSFAKRGPEALRLGEDFTPGSQLVVEGEESAVERAVAALRQELAGVSVSSQRLGDDTGAGFLPAPEHETKRERAVAGTRHLISLSAPLGESPTGEGEEATLDAASVLARVESESVEVESVHSIDGKVSARRLAASSKVLLVSFVLLGVYFAFLQQGVERLLSSSPPPGVPRAVRSRVLVGILTALGADLVFVATSMTLADIPLNLPVVGALLSIVGYSVNDSVVLWSHVRREWTASRGESPRPSGREVVVRAVDRILGRASLTSLSTLVPVLAILIVGVAPLRDFAIVLAVGVVAGTFSSLFVVGTFAARALERHTKRSHRRRERSEGSLVAPTSATGSSRSLG